MWRKNVFETIKAAVYDLWSGPAALAPDSQKALSAIRRLLDSISREGYGPKKAVVAAERSIKSIFIHAFMNVFAPIWRKNADPYTFDLARASARCNAYPLADGRFMNVFAPIWRKNAPACVFNCLRR